jgi:hypothetical protein
MTAKMAEHSGSMRRSFQNSMRRSMIEVYRLSGTKIHHPISDLDLLFLPSFPYLKIASSSQAEKK